jgi:nucleoside-diphosphate kinase
MERTYVMLKPDAYEKKIIGKVIARIEAEGFKIINIKMMRLTQQILNEHYSHLIGQDFFPALVEFMMSQPVIAMVVEGENAIARMRQIMGPTKYGPVLSAGTIRGEFQDRTNVKRNVIHGSDSKETAEIEIKRFFGDNYEL